MKFISWNVNGIRSILKKGFLDFVKKENPDILCLQETRAESSEVELPFNEYHAHWNSSRVKSGYAGTAIFTKIEPKSVTCGMAIQEHDQEGRVITVEFSAGGGSANLCGGDGFYLVNAYTPNSKRDLSRLDYRQKWDREFLKFLKKLEEKKPVVFCGDLNVAHKEIDLANPESNHKNHGFTDEERTGFSNFVKSGFLDTFREFIDEGGHYTWWSQMNNCRKRNIGWRIDYFLVSKSLRPYLKDAAILSDVMGSDHCPVGIELDKP